MENTGLKGLGTRLSRLPIPAVLTALALVVWAAYALLVLSESTAWWVPERLHRLVALPDETSTTLARRGQFGDAFGAFNALVSTLALVSLLTTLGVQRRQLAAQQTQTQSEVRLMRQQQFQEQYYRAVDAYRMLLAEFQPMQRAGRLQDVGMRGRAGLFVVWRELMLEPLAAQDGLTGETVRAQITASLDPAPDSDRDINARRQIAQVLSQAAADSRLRARMLAGISRQWSKLYSSHRFQLDALFRAWYTVYRILDTAPRYELEDEVVRLYGASFRAQLSWIELAFLLVNQSGLHPGTGFPKACKLSNTYAVFDNLVDDDDLVVACLSMIAREREADPAGFELNRQGFGLQVPDQSNLRLFRA